MTTPTTTILILSASPQGEYPRQLDVERREIEEGLIQRSKHRDRFRLDKQDAVRPRDIQRAMLDINPQIVHFAGYGKGEEGLIFEDEFGHPKFVDGTALAGLFSLFSDQLKCVVLNACYSQVQAEAIAQHIPYVIGMSQALGEKAAIEFAVGFYDALGAGRDIEFAFNLGCNAIRMAGSAEHLTPVLTKKPGVGSVVLASAIEAQASVNFQSYLRSILNNEDYREWQEVYTPTTVEDRKRSHRVNQDESPQPKFSSRLKLRVEAVKPPESENQRTESTEQREQVEQLEVLAGLRKYAPEHVLLVGKPGSGKSTSLERLLWEEADRALKQSANAKIPVLVKLRRCTGTIEVLIQDFCRSHQLPLTIADIETWLDQGKLLLLLDGLNELPEAFRTTLANFRDRYRATTPMIVSTRELSIGGNLGIAKTLKMLPLTEPQMQEFVRSYLGQEGKRLFWQLKGDKLRKFAETPLLLWMLCRIFARNDRVPANLGLAFREFTQLYDAEIQQDAPTDSREQWSKLLRHLAFALMHDREPTDFRLSMPREEAADLLTTCLQQEGRANARDCAERWLKDLLSYHLIQPVMQPNYEEHSSFAIS